MSSLYPHPWKLHPGRNRLYLERDESSYQSIMQDAFYIGDAQNHGSGFVADVIVRKGDEETAAYIVRAANAYPALVAALRLALERLERLEFDDHETIGWSPATEACRAALAEQET